MDLQQISKGWSHAFFSIHLVGVKIRKIEHRSEKSFLGCLIVVENWRYFGGTQVFSLYTHQKPISPIWRKN